MQPAISTPPLATIVELEDSDEEEGLRGLRTNIFNKISSSVQALVTFILANQSNQLLLQDIPQSKLQSLQRQSKILSEQSHTFLLFQNK